MNSRLRERLLLIAGTIVLTALVSSCQGKVDPAFVSSSDISLRVKDETVLTYDPLTWQASFNREKCEWGMHTDNMSDYWRVHLASVPTSEGQKARGSIEWTDNSSVNSRSDVTFTVEKTDRSGHLWLWCRKERIGVVVQTLD